MTAYRLVDDSIQAVDGMQAVDLQSVAARRFCAPHTLNIVPSPATVQSRG